MEVEMIYLARYCGCIYESSYGTISVHRTRLGAEKAIANHKEEIRDQYKSVFDYDRDMRWDIDEINLMD